MNIPWGSVIEALLELLAECQARGRSKSELRTALREPGPLQEFLLGQAIRRKLVLAPRQWRRQKDEIMSAVMNRHQELGEFEFDSLLTEAAELAETAGED